MPKLLVMSDSHQNISRMMYAAEKSKPDAIIHLGDHISDAHELQLLFPDTMYYMVKGNCDYGAGESELLLEFGGVRLYMTHGHIHGVKRGLDELVNAARQKDAALALYGHTHKALIQQLPGLWLMNPGQMERHDSKRPASYGIITIENGSYNCRIEYLPFN